MLQKRGFWSICRLSFFSFLPHLLAASPLGVGTMFVALPSIPHCGHTPGDILYFFTLCCLSTMEFMDRVRAGKSNFEHSLTSLYLLVIVLSPVLFVMSP